MRQNKKPLLLITIVSVIVLLLVGLNMSQFLRYQDRYQDIKPPDQKTQEELAKREANQVGTGSSGGAIISRMQDSMNLGSGNVAISIADVPDRPSIVLPNQMAYVEQYQGGNTTSSGWYNDNSYQQTEAENREKGTGKGN